MSLGGCTASARTPHPGRSEGPPSSTQPSPDALASCPGSQTLAALAPLARIPGDDDDLALDASGDVWVSQPEHGRIFEVSPAGAVVRAFADPDGPEGIVLTADGRLFLAEQRTNHIDLVDPSTGARSFFAAVPGATGLDTGIDGLGVDPAHSRLLVPDSPEGTLLAIPLSGGTPTTLARGLGRPVSVAVAPDGGLLVAEENSPGLVEVGAGGATRTVTPPGRIRSADEVVVRGGLAYVTDLIAGTVEAVEPSSGRSATLVTGSPAPQGLGFAPDGRLVLADSVRGEIVSIPGCSQ